MVAALSVYPFCLNLTKESAVAYLRHAVHLGCCFNYKHFATYGAMTCYDSIVNG